MVTGGREQQSSSEDQAGWMQGGKKI